MSKITIDRSLLQQAIDALEKERPYLGPMPSKTSAAITALREALAQPQQEPLTLMNNLALKIASDAISYRELVCNLSGKVMGVAMSAESVKGQTNRVQVTAEAMSDLRRFVEEGLTERLAFHDKHFDTHKAAAWKLNTA